jgi:uncharacterized membrane protein AbrB (regulator of aidB expression)
MQNKKWAICVILFFILIAESCYFGYLIKKMRSLKENLKLEQMYK